MGRPYNLRWYYTDPASSGDGTTTGTAASSTGGYRTTTLVPQKSIDQNTTDATGISIVLASADMVDGDGQIRFSPSSGKAYWKAPSGTEGVGTDVDASGLYGLENRGASEQFIVVQSTHSDLPAVAATDNNIALSDDYYEKVFDDVAYTEAASGLIDYRCLCVKNHSSTPVCDVRLWFSGIAYTTLASDVSADATTVTVTSTEGIPCPGYIKVGSEWIYHTVRVGTTLYNCARGEKSTSAASHSAGDVVQGETVVGVAVEAPSIQPDGTASLSGSGFSYSTPRTMSDAVIVPQILAGEIYFVWMKRVVEAGAIAAPNSELQLHAEWIGV